MTAAADPKRGLPPPPPPEWRLSPPPEPTQVDRLARELSLPRALCGVLAARRITDPEAAKRFLRPRLDDLHPPEAMADLDRAADRLAAAASGEEAVLVHGDYDVDGIAATALLTRWLRRLGARPVPFVPDRLRHGYDLSEAGVRAAREAGASLLVTCDCGILAHGAVAAAAGDGIEVIVTDHHTPGDTLPPALAVVNPAREDCAYPDPRLSGTGVAFKLCQALAQRAGIPREELWPHLDLVALATVADLVPLSGENRVLVRYGLRYLAHTGKAGLRALLAVSGLSPGEPLDAGHVGFVLGPRINAAGRMGDPSAAVRLLLTADEEEARRLARRLDGQNVRRREEEARTLDEAVDALVAGFDPDRDFGVVLAREEWHPGVIGIVASRVVELIHRPAVLVGLQGTRGRGSARSIPGVDLFRALQGCAEHLDRFGGHRQAAGLDVSKDALDAFRDAFNGRVAEQLQGRPPRPVVRGELDLPLAEANEELHRWLHHLGPFGRGNPRPVFRARELEVAGEPRRVGKGHLKLRLRGGGRELEAIGFGLADRILLDGLAASPVDALFQLRENEYRGVTTLQARLVDLRPSRRDG